MPVNGQWLVESQLWATKRQNGQGGGGGGGGGEGYEKLKRVIVIKELIVLVCR